MFYDRVVTLDKKSSFNNEDFKKFLLAVAYIKSGEFDFVKISNAASKVDRVNDGTLKNLYVKLSGENSYWFDDITPFVIKKKVFCHLI